MKADLSTQQLVKGFSTFLHRYHILIFTLIVAGGLSATTFTLYRAIDTPQPASTSTASTSFDAATINKINKLRSPSDPVSPLSLPAGRTDPFQE